MADENRRRFLKAATVATGGAMTLVVSVPVGGFLLFPIHERVVSDPSEPIDVMAVDELASDGPPVKVQLIGNGVKDGWTVQSGVVLGSAFLQKKPDGEVVAFSSVCPHLGCAIAYDSGADLFKCPCHRSAFALTGERLEGPSKRGLDTLEVSVQDGRIRVRFQRFRADIADKVPV